MLKGVSTDLERNAMMSKMIKDTRTVLPDIEGAVEKQLINPLHRPIMIANAILKRVGKNIEPKYDRILTELQNDPAKMADILRLPASNPDKQMLIELMQRAGIIGATRTATEGEM